jgi:hypothetical protein
MPESCSAAKIKPRVLALGSVLQVPWKGDQSDQSPSASSRALFSRAIASFEPPLSR